MIKIKIKDTLDAAPMDALVRQYCISREHHCSGCPMKAKEDFAVGITCLLILKAASLTPEEYKKSRALKELIKLSDTARDLIPKNVVVAKYKKYKDMEVEV